MDIEWLKPGVFIGSIAYALVGVAGHSVTTHRSESRRS